MTSEEFRDKVAKLAEEYFRSTKYVQVSTIEIEWRSIGEVHNVNFWASPHLMFKDDSQDLM